MFVGGMLALRSLKAVVFTLLGLFAAVLMSELSLRGSTFSLGR